MIEGWESRMLTFLIIIVAVCLLGFLGFFIYQRQLGKKVTQSYEDKKKLFSIPLDEEFELSQKLNLTGESQKRYEQLLDDYRDIREEEIPHIDKQIQKVQEDTKGINFIKTNQDRTELKKAISSVDSRIKNIQAELVSLQDLNKQHSLATDELNDRYGQLRQQLLKQNEELGDSLDALEKMLAGIEAKFDDFNNLSKQGDHDSAETVLAELNEDTKQLETYMEVIPGLYNELKTVFPQQVSELKKAYQSFTQRGFNFPNDKFDSNISHVETQIKQNHDNIKTLKIDVATEVNGDISRRIDRMYQVFENAMADKQDVDKNTKVIDKYLDHLKKQNVDLSRRLERLNIDYVLDHQEIENNRQYTEQIRSLGTEVIRQKESVQRGEAVYSQVKVQQKQILKNLEQIENLQLDLYERVKGFPEEERLANQALKEFDVEMRNKKRRIHNLNLPGTPKDYTALFNDVVKEIERMNQAMTSPKVDIEEVSKQQVMIQSDMDTLEEATDQLIDEALLAEQSMQYANRYINIDSAVATARRDAYEAFNNYDYARSLAIVSTALETVQKGSYQKIEQDYFTNKETQAKIKSTDDPSPKADD